MSDVVERAGTGWRVPRISEIFAWLGRATARPRQLVRLDPALVRDDLLRDIGLLDGRGPSLRRPERTGDIRFRGFA